MILASLSLSWNPSRRDDPGSVWIASERFSVYTSHNVTDGVSHPPSDIDCPGWPSQCPIS
jgi:hypothetical protein